MRTTTERSSCEKHFRELRTGYACLSGYVTDVYVYLNRNRTNRDETLVGLRKRNLRVSVGFTAVSALFGRNMANAFTKIKYIVGTTIMQTNL